MLFLICSYCKKIFGLDGFGVFIRKKVICVGTVLYMFSLCFIYNHCRHCYINITERKPQTLSKQSPTNFTFTQKTVYCMAIGSLCARNLMEKKIPAIKKP